METPKSISRFLQRKDLFLYATLLISIIGMLGWVIGKETLTSFSLSLIPMAPATAILFFKLSLAMLTSIYFYKSTFENLFIKSLILLVALVCGFIFISYIFNFSWDIEKVFIEKHEFVGDIQKGRMSPITALLFIFICIGIIAIRQNSSNVFKYIGGSLSLLVCLISTVLCIGYLYKAPLLYGSGIIPVALPTAICFLLLSIAILRLSQYQFWTLNLLKQNTIQSILINSFLPIVVIIIILQNFLITNAAYYHNNPTYGAAVILLGFIAITLIVVYKISGVLDFKLRTAEQKIRESQILLQSSIESPKGMIILSIDKHYKYLYFNAFHKESMIYAYGKDVQIGMNLLDCITEECDRIKAKENYDRALAGESHITIQEFGDEERYYYETRYNPIFNDDNEIIGATAFSTNITDRILTEEKIREKDILFRKLSANVPDLIFQFTKRPDGTYYVPIASEGIKNIFGCSPEDVINDFAPISNVIYPEDLARVISEIEYSAEHLTFFTCEFRVQIPGKPIQWIFSRSAPEKLANGSVTWYGFNADITQRKQAELMLQEKKSEIEAQNEEYKKINDELYLAKEKAQESEMQLNKAQQTAKIGSWKWYIQENKLWWSEEMYNIFEIDKNSFTGELDKVIERAIHPDDKEKVDQSNYSVMVYNKPIPVEYRLNTKDGTVKYVLGLADNIVLDENGKSVFLTGIVKDITEYKNNQIELQKAKEKAELVSTRFKMMFTEAPLGIALVDSFTGFIYEANPKFAEIAGRTIEQVMNIDWMSITHPDDIQADLDNMALLNAGKISGFKMQKRYIQPNGNYVWINMTIAPIVVDANEGKRHLCMIEDISQNKHNESILKIAKEQAEESERKFNLFMQKTPAFVYIKDDTLKHIYSNSAVENILSKTHSETTSSSDIFEPEIVKLLENADISILNGEKDSAILEYSAIINNKLTFFRDFKFAMKLPDDKPAVGGIAFDITSNKIAETKIANLSKILQTSLNEIYIFDKESFKFIYINEGALRNIGFSLEEMSEKTPWDIKPEYNEKQFVDYVAPLKNNEIEVLRFETIHQRKDKSTYNVYVTLQLAEYENKEVFAAIILNITEKKQYEIELIKAKEKAEEADRLKTAFLNNMSHEIRTPMNAIVGFSGMLARNFNNKTKLEKFANIINQQCANLLYIINEILEIAKIESGQLPVKITECDVSTLFSELEHFFTEYKSRLDKNDITFRMKVLCDPSDLIILTDKVKLKQILINLIENAFKFTDAGTIDCGCKYDENGNLLFYVSDTGIGISHDKQELIFKRFAQVDHGSSRLYGGTGLGLSIVKGLVGLLGGEIFVESQPNIGSKFSFTLPIKLVQTPPIQTIGIQKSEEFMFKNKTVLIVEDDFFNAEYLKEILNGKGLTILHAILGNEAIQIALNQHLDLVLMDIRLPDTDGYQATQQMILNNPHLKIIAQTAYASDFDKQKAINAGCIDYISKPIKEDLMLSLLCKYLPKF